MLLTGRRVLREGLCSSHGGSMGYVRANVNVGRSGKEERAEQSSNATKAKAASVVGAGYIRDGLKAGAS